jgi:hypothetical protein
MVFNVLKPTVSPSKERKASRKLPLLVMARRRPQKES